MFKKICFMSFMMIESLTLHLARAEPQPISPENVFILQNVVNQYKSNIESIRTWQGEAILEEKVLSMQDRDSRETKARIRFWVDVPQNRQMFIYEPLEDVQLAADGTLRPVVLETKATLIFKDEPLCYSRTAYDPKGYISISDGQGGTRFVRGEDTDSYDMSMLRGNISISVETKSKYNPYQLEYTFDPFVVMGHLVMQYPRQFEMIDARFKQGHDVSMYQIDIQGDRISLVGRLLSNNKEVTNICTVDNSIRCCPVETVSSVPGEIDTVYLSEYEQCEGVFVPKRVLQDVKLGGIKTSITFNKNIINEKIPDDVFTLKTLGAVLGDSVYDQRTDTTYPLGKEECPDCPSPNFTEIAPRSNSQILKTLLMGMGAIFIGIFVFLKYRQRRRGRTEAVS